MSFSDVVQAAGNVYRFANGVSSVLQNADKQGFIRLTDSGGGACPIIEEMFAPNGMSYEQMQSSMLSAHENLENTQHADVFHFEVIRQAPSFPAEKSLVISAMVTGVEITSYGLNAEEVAVGSTFYNELKDVQGGEVQVTFLESKNGDVRDFLTKRVATSIKSSGSAMANLQNGISTAQRVGNIFGADTSALGQVGEILNILGTGGARYGENIMPVDGTYLLPYDYYFSIKVSHLVRVDKQTVEKVMLAGEFILDGGISTGYTAGDEQYLTTSATFKPLQGWEN